MPILLMSLFLKLKYQNKILNIIYIIFLMYYVKTNDILILFWLLSNAYNSKLICNNTLNRSIESKHRQANINLLGTISSHTNLMWHLECVPVFPPLSVVRINFTLVN